MNMLVIESPVSPHRYRYSTAEVHELHDTHPPGCLFLLWQSETLLYRQYRAVCNVQLTVTARWSHCIYYSPSTWRFSSSKLVVDYAMVEIKIKAFDPISILASQDPVLNSLSFSFRATGINDWFNVPPARLHFIPTQNGTTPAQKVHPPLIM